MSKDAKKEPALVEANRFLNEKEAAELKAKMTKAMEPESPAAPLVVIKPVIAPKVKEPANV